MNKGIFLERKKGVSPIVATVLLVALVIVTALIIFLWFRGFVGESVTKFGKNIELVCDEVKFDASYSGSNFYISNNGNVPIFGMKVKITEGGSYETKDLSEMSAEWPDDGLTAGGAFSGDVQPGASTTNIVLNTVL